MEEKLDTNALRAQMNDLATQLITDPKKIEEFCAQWSQGFHNYSFGNLLLIHFQKRSATLCAGFGTWKSKKRNVRKGEKAIKILAPCVLKDKDDEEKTKIFYRTVSVFDISQTDGEPIELGHSDKISGTISFADISKKLGYDVALTGPRHENGSTDGQKIWITKKENETAMTATLFHEVAHIELKHCQNGLLSDSEIVPCDIKEIEAESVAYLVCCALKIENKKSALYLSSFGATAEKLENSATKILKVAESIIKKVLSKPEGE